MILIDGSLGEGGGQILRSALALSMVTGKPFRIEKIRAHRAKPGLLRQHLTAVTAAAEISGADVEGAAIGSARLTFTPGRIRPGSYAFAIGTAGSTTLVLQAVLPALLTADGPSSLILEGGTHNTMAPPVDFLREAFLPLIGRMGPRVEARLERAGFYPAGGGKITVRIEPAARLAPLALTDRGAILSRRAVATVAGLSRRIAERELAVVGRKLNWAPESFAVSELPADQGPGNVLILEIASENVTEVFTGFGERGVTSEAVAERAVAEAREYLAAGVPVGRHLADQLMLPMALAGEGSFVTLPLTRHATTNLEIIRAFLDIDVATRQLTDLRHLVQFGAAGSDLNAP
jgi:RNA 3'-terminal phosphate cyclase (ATP)